MKKAASVVCTTLLAMGLFTAPAMAADVTVTLPTFPVTLNGVTMEQSKSQYPMLVYKDITYVPMTWADTRLLGLESNWTQQGGLVINKAGTVQSQAEARNAYAPYKANTANKSSYPAVTASGKITVNKKAITNSSEQYPLLVFRDVTYFPLTWRFAVNEFGWEYSFDQKNGLVITPKATASGSGDSTVNTKGDIVGQKVKVNASDVNLRADAGTNSAAVGMAQKGTELIVLGTKTVNGKEWYQVMKTDGSSKSWIAGWLTVKSSDAANSNSNNSNNNSSVDTSSNGNISASTDKADAMVGKNITVTGSVVNLRSNTSTSSAVVGQAKKGDVYNVLAAKTVNGEAWYQVKTQSGVKAWIAGWLTQSGGNISSSDNNQSNNDGNNNTATENYDIVGKQVMVNANGVNLRKEPGTSSATAGTANKGMVFTVLSLKTVDGKQWYQVKDVSGDKVWIASWLADRTDSTSTVIPQSRLTLEGVQQQGSKTIVTFKHGKGNGYGVSKVNATELVVSLQNNYLNTNDSINESYSNGPLHHLQVQDAGAGTLKATLDLQKGAYCTIKENGDNLVITVYRQQSGLAGKTIVIDPGHGGSDPGAIGKVLGVTDADVGLTVGQKLRDLLEAQGAEVIMTRDSDVRVGLNDRPAMANKVEADIFVSIHGNSATNTTAKGIQVYYYAPSSNANLYGQSYIRKELASEVSSALQNVTGTSASIKTSNLAVLRENDRPCILVETGFLSNAEEEKLLASDDYRQQLANGIYQGIRNYLNQW